MTCSKVLDPKKDLIVTMGAFPFPITVDVTVANKRINNFCLLCTMSDGINPVGPIGSMTPGHLV